MKSKEILPISERRMIPEDWNGNEEKLLGKKGGLSNQPLISKDYIYKMYKAFLGMESELETINQHMSMGVDLRGPLPDIEDEQETK